MFCSLKTLSNLNSFRNAKRRPQPRHSGGRNFDGSACAAQFRRVPTEKSLRSPRIEPNISNMYVTVAARAIGHFIFRCQRISPENRYVLASCETALNEATIAKGYRNVNFFVGRIRRVRSSRLRTYRCSPLQYVRVPTRPHLGSVL